mmetsp:Transcript_9298/g.10323  ORF Transcript_9298/g.10323 Transcript_9298/m.10323 type:complete len:135 (+) Transcript_9298:120-524(+)
MSIYICLYCISSSFLLFKNQREILFRVVDFVDDDDDGDDDDALGCWVLLVSPHNNSYFHHLHYHLRTYVPIRNDCVPQYCDCADESNDSDSDYEYDRVLGTHLYLSLLLYNRNHDPPPRRLYDCVHVVLPVLTG